MPQREGVRLTSGNLKVVWEDSDDGRVGADVLDDFLGTLAGDTSPESRLEGRLDDGGSGRDTENLTLSREGGISNERRR